MGGGGANFLSYVAIFSIICPKFVRPYDPDFLHKIAEICYSVGKTCLVRISDTRGRWLTGCVSCRFKAFSVAACLDTLEFANCGSNNDNSGVDD